MIKRCHNCKSARNIPEVSLSVMCTNRGETVSSFREACDEFDEDPARMRKGNVLLKRLEEKKLAWGGFSNADTY